MNEVAEHVADYTLLGDVEPDGDQELYAAVPPDRLGLTERRVLLRLVPAGGGAPQTRRAADELRMFAAVRSPHLVELYDAGQDGDWVFYAMEYPARGTLRRPTTELSQVERLGAVADAARGAHALHEAGIVHRNITPSNILLEAELAKLANLGMAKALDQAGSVSRFPNVDDIEYLDPTIMLGGSPSRATDTWSLGVVLHWTMSGGASLHPGRSSSDAFGAVRQVITEPPMISTELPADVEAVVRRALSPEIADRPSTAEALAREIDALVEDRS
jgi:eukaryotic-like serine/threonine-protein kinase